MKPEVYKGFDPDQILNYFKGRGWTVSTIPIGSVELASVTKNSHVRCGDGRYDGWPEGQLSPRLFGGVNGVMALVTGGDEAGMLMAAQLLREHEATPGTHSADNNGGCGFVDLWRAGKLESARHPYLLPQAPNLGQWLKEKMQSLGGRHDRLTGLHQEEGVRLNPFDGHTEKASDGLRFRIDEWLMVRLGVGNAVRWLQIAETTEKLRPEAAVLEVIVP